MADKFKDIARFTKASLVPHWRMFVIILAPLLPIGLLSDHYDEPAARCAWGVIIMSVYWMTEAVPLVITGMLPVLLFPVLGLIDTDTVSKLYLTKSNMLRMTGLMVAVAIENVGLHKRIALRILLLTGTSPRRIMLGFMLATVLISMWISNAAASAMMVPIVQAVLEEIYEKHVEQKATEDKSILPRVADGLFSHHTDFRDEARASETEVSAYSRQVVQIPTNCCSEVDVEKPSEEVLNPVSMRDDVKKQYHKARIGNLIAVCFAANLGGTGVVTGCAPNLILLGILDTLYESTQLNFATWMLFNIPGMLINVFLGWLWLQASFFNLRVEDVVRLFKKQQRETVSEDVRKRWDDEKASQSRARDVIQRRHEALGPIRFEEAITLFLFVVLVASWIFRAPRFVTGWSAWFERDVSEATPCVLIIFLMFIIPRTPSNPFSSTHQPSETSRGLLTWQIIHEKMPWNVIILMGGAIAMADVCKTSGLTAVLGTQFAKINFLSPGWLLLLMTTLTAFLTELASNAATASIILPILNSMARELNIHPLYLMLPATITTSYSFMLPVANPPNAITYTAAGNMKVSDMAKAGFLMNIIGILVLNIMTNTYGTLVFDFNHFPTLIADDSTTTSSTTTLGTMLRVSNSTDSPSL